MVALYRTEEGWIVFIERSHRSHKRSSRTWV
jgi:hypothetical protein